MTDTTKTTETRMGLVTCGKDFKTLHIGTVVYEIKDAGKPWESRRTIEATSGCAGSRHVSNKHMDNIQNATCPRCRAAYLGEQVASEVKAEPTRIAKPEPDAIGKGDFLTLTYGNGTQTAYVSETTENRLMIYRLVGYTGKWTGPRPMSRNDGRIIGRVASLEGVQPPAAGFIPAR
jgi:hypothetical protein